MNSASSEQTLREYTSERGFKVFANTLAEALAQVAKSGDSQIVSTREVAGYAGTAHADADPVRRTSTAREIFRRRQEQAAGAQAEVPVRGEGVFARRAREAQAFRDGIAASPGAEGARVGSLEYASAIYRRRGTAPQGASE